MKEVKEVHEKEEIKVDEGSGKLTSCSVPYSEISLDVIKGTNILSKEDLNLLVELKPALEDTFRKNQVFRSEYELRNSVLNDVRFPGPDAKYWQMVREQDVHFHELVMLSFEFRKLREKMKLQEYELAELERKCVQIDSPDTLEKVRSEYRVKKKKIDLEQNIFVAKNMMRVAKDRIREIKTHETIKRELIPNMEFGIESYEHHQPRSSLLRFHREIEACKVAGAKVGPAEARNLLGQYVMAANHPENVGLRKQLTQGNLFPELTDKPVKDELPAPDEQDTGEKQPGRVNIR